jgi:hypothetical protein
MRLIYLSPVVWDSYEQRPHYFVRDFLARGGQSVIWVNPYSARLPSWRDLTRSDWQEPPTILDRPAGLRVIDAGGLPVDPLPGGRHVNGRLFWKTVLEGLRSKTTPQDTIVGVGRPTAFAVAALSTLDAAATFYDAMDDFPEFYRGRSRESTMRIERDIASRVDRVIVSSSSLVRKFSTGRKPVTLLRNAYDMSLLPAYEGTPKTSPSFGFIGCLGRWFDWRTTSRLAEAVDPAPVTIIGPKASRLPARLPPNLILHPPCTQIEGARWLQQFTVGLIPFTLDALTTGVDPIKYYQYRAAWLPVLSTKFGEMAARNASDATFFLEAGPGFEESIAAALAFRPAPAEVASFREGNTWTARFNEARLWDVGAPIQRLSS